MASDSEQKPSSGQQSSGNGGDQNPKPTRMSQVVFDANKRSADYASAPRLNTRRTTGTQIVRRPSNEKKK